MGIGVWFYDLLSNNEEYDFDIQREYMKSSNHAKRLKNTYSKNKKKKHRNVYHKKRVSKMYRHRKGLISKKEYYKKSDSCAATLWWLVFLIPTF